MADPVPGRRGAAVLLVALGTPQAPTSAAVRRYLREFLSDPRVVPLPRLVWWPILYGIVLNTRPRVSARKYASIWTPEGSPLKVHTERQAKLVRGYLGERLAAPVPVEYAMRYGEPSISRVLDRLSAGGAERVVVVPLYPQYAASTTASAEDAVRGYRGAKRARLALRVVRDFHDHPGYIAALAAQLRSHREASAGLGRVLLSFHGLPQRAVDQGDPYRDQCEKTAHLLAAAAGLAQGEWQVAFQSRFGAAEWLKPYTADTLAGWAAAGVRRVDVVCPGFVSDCLETLEEIGIEGKRRFLEAGGSEFHLLPCLNERHEWIGALADIVAGELGRFG